MCLPQLKPSKVGARPRKSRDFLISKHEAKFINVKGFILKLIISLASEEWILRSFGKVKLVNFMFLSIIMAGLSEKGVPIFSTFY